MKKSIELSLAIQEKIFDPLKAYYVGHGFKEVSNRPIIMGNGRRNNSASVWAVYSSGKMEHRAEFSNSSEAQHFSEYLLEHSRLPAIIINPETINLFKPVLA